MKYAKNVHQYIVLFSNCFLTKGVVRSIIVDGYRGNFNFIPNDLYLLLVENADVTLGELYASYDEENQHIIDEYLDFLLEKELIFFASALEKKHFPALSTDWDFPGQIANAILDFTDEHHYDLINALKQLDDLQCQALHLRIFKPVTIDWLRAVLEEIATLTIEDVSIALPFDQAYTEAAIKMLALTYQKISTIIVHTAPETRHIRGESIEKLAGLFYIEDVIQDETHCGQVIPEYFSVNLLHYFESLAWNTCLNRKISVDRFGYIKNCPSIKKTYGHIRAESLKKALQLGELQRMWTIDKSQVVTCQVCEFRHICTDCRAYLSEPENMYSKPAKCSYDPYLGAWN